MPTRDELRLALMARAYQWVDGMSDEEVAQVRFLHTHVIFRERLGEGEPIGDTYDEFDPDPPDMTRMGEMFRLFAEQALRFGMVRGMPAPPEPDSPAPPPTFWETLRSEE